MARKSTLAALALLLLQSQSFAEDHSLAVKAGALGLGVEYTYALSDRVALRGGINGSELGFDGEESGIDYDFDLVWDSLSVAVDFHPLRSPLRLTGGLLANDNRLEAVSRPTSNVTIGDTTYTPAQIGTLNGLAGFDDTAPFVGVGWDWSRGNRVFGMSFDLGVVSQGSPTVSLTSTSVFANNAAFRDDIAAEQAQLEDSLDDLDLAPYATIGFVFRF